MSSETTLINPIIPELIPKLDPQFVDIYTKYQAPHTRADQVTIEEYRKNTPKYTFPIAPGPSPAVGDVKIYKVPVSAPAGEIDVQVFFPTPEAISKGGLKSPDGKLPCHVDYHGGGWVIGSLKSDESWCRQACLALGCIIANVDYRLAPEFPHPVQVTDSFAALKYLFAHAPEIGIDPARVSVGGLSAGGHIAAVMALLARDEPALPPLALQLLIVPAVDARWVPLEGGVDPKVCPYETYTTCEFAPCLPLQRMRWFSKLWIGTDPQKRKEAADSWLASPILAPSLAGLAPASIHTAEFDVLRSEAEAYHALLLKSGSPSTYKMYAGVCHPFGHWDGMLDKGKEYVRDTCAALKKAYTV